MAAALRMMWAFARHFDLPGSQYIDRVHKSSKLPIYSILTTATITLLLVLIKIASTAAFNALVSLVAGGFLGSYMLPIVFILYRRLSQYSTFPPLKFGPWYLGRFSVPTNIVALIWAAIAMFLGFWPTVSPVDATSMNYSSLLWGGTTLFGVVYYVVHGKKDWKGPRIETSVVEGVRDV